MIDETYVEFAPDINAITAVPLTREFTNLMVLRGVSKFFAAPGMRLGYGITGNMDFLAKMREKQTPWSLNSLGAFAGEITIRTLTNAALLSAVFFTCIVFFSPSISSLILVS